MKNTKIMSAAQVRNAEAKVVRSIIRKHAIFFMQYTDDRANGKRVAFKGTSERDTWLKILRKVSAQYKGWKAYVPGPAASQDRSLSHWVYGIVKHF